MAYTLLSGDLVQNAHDEKLTKRFGGTYKYFKKLYPDLYKLPENEINEIYQTFRQNPRGDTTQKALDRTHNFIKVNMPRWQKEYFNPPKHSQTLQGLRTNANPNTLYQGLPTYGNIGGFQPLSITPKPQTTIGETVSVKQTYPMGFAGQRSSNVDDDDFDDDDGNQEFYRPHMNLIGFTGDKWKEGYDTFDQDFPETIDKSINNNILVNDCIESPRYQEFINNTELNEGVGFVQPPLSDQPTMTGISQAYYDSLRGKNQTFKKHYPENLQDLTPDQQKNIYCQMFYKPSHAEIYKHPRIRNMMADQYVLRNTEPFVKIIQQQLVNMGYDLRSDENDPTNGVDGVLGSRTVKALNSLENPDAFVENLKSTLFKTLKPDPRFQNGWYNRIYRY